MHNNITTEDFEIWKEHYITKQLYVHLHSIRESVVEGLQDENLYSPEGLLKLKRLCGTRSIIDIILNIQLEDFIDEDKSSRVQNPSEAETRERED